MRISRALVALLAPALLASALAAPADAAVLVIDDPAGNGQKGDALDITAVKVANGAKALVAKVTFVRATHGDLALYLHARGDRRRDVVGVISEHRARQDDNWLLTADGRQECGGLKVVWDHDADTVRIKLPARCFDDGDYDAVQVRMITEIGSDADLAPSTPAGGWPWSAYVARG